MSSASEPVEYYRFHCRSKPDCPLPGKCLVESVVYQATVEAENSSETYVGLTANTFKARFGGRKSSFKKEQAQICAEGCEGVYE